MYFLYSSSYISLYSPIHLFYQLSLIFNKLFKKLCIYKSQSFICPQENLSLGQTISVDFSGGNESNRPRTLIIMKVKHKNSVLLLCIRHQYIHLYYIFFFTIMLKSKRYL